MTAFTTDKPCRTKGQPAAQRQGLAQAARLARHDEGSKLDATVELYLETADIATTHHMCAVSTL